MKQPESRPPSLALIGCGYWGRNLARNFHDLKALHTICEASRHAHQELRGHYPDLNLESELSAVLENPDIREVAIAAPAAQHFKLAKEALAHGKDVFVEKPFCLEADQGRCLQEMAEKEGRILMVGHLLQYHPVICRLQDMVKSGSFGRLFRLTSHRLNLGKVRTEENAFWSLAPHDTSVILSLVPDSVPVSVQSIAETYLQPDVSDCSLTSILFSNGVTAEIQVSWLHPFKEQKLCVIAENAMAVFDDTQDWRAKLSLRENYFESKAITPIPIAPEEPLRRECQHFIDCCHQRRQPKTDAAEGIRVLEILEAAQKSANQNGARITLGSNPPRMS